MKNNNIIRKRLLGCFRYLMNAVRLFGKCSLLLVLIQGTIVFNSLQAQNTNSKDQILKAYELRLSGNNDEAQTILKSVLQADSTNAMAHYELAKTFPMLSDQRLHHYQKASEYEPENPMYCFYHADYIMLQAYVAMKKNEPEQSIKEIVNRSCDHLKEVLKIKPECKETLLFLVDIYGSLPENFGGNKAEAQKYVEKLKKSAPVYAAQGEWILSSDKMELSQYWLAYMDKNGKQKDVQIKLGKAYLLNDNIDKAKECFNKIITNNPDECILYLDLARAHLYRAMRGASAPEVEIPEIKKYINKYLDMEQNKPLNIEAWCYGWLGTLSGKIGEKEEAEMYFAKAKETLPNYSRASAIPKKENPPNIVAYQFSSYFSPF
ncbi:hypothetical protein DF185_00340 [Marinifilum breve]|uniref:Tetratricopeptide repeat protein n=1 Tax=Marinifilum breve TaxID=2184082 RepID=A0A2V4A3V2_9BACT|nr:tetratricopeptide repeat protein [Marinifilum breve]PXY02577.1 hypothetical protein DF185_00340 [Marinifilum breve]